MRLPACCYRLTAPFGLRATGHTASDQVETVLLRLLASGAPRGIRVRRADGVVRPLLTVWREETRAYCRAHDLAWREDATNPSTRRGVLRERVLPLQRPELHISIAGRCRPPFELVEFSSQRSHPFARDLGIIFIRAGKPVAFSPYLLVKIGNLRA